MPRLDTRGRVIREPSWPFGGMVSKPIGDRNYDVQMFTGYPTSTVASGQWRRGIVLRFGGMQLRPSGRNLFMYDPTNPATWNNRNIG